MRILPLFLCVLMLSACGYRHAPLPETAGDKDIVERELVRSRAEILSRLSELQAVSTPRPAPIINGTAPYDLSYPVRLLWEGSLEQGLATLGVRVGWQAKRYGPSPTQDIIVSCDPTDSGFEIIQKFQAQAGSRASITIDEANRIIKLVYAGDIAPRRARHARNPRLRHTKPRVKPAAISVPSSHKPTLSVNTPAPAPIPEAAPAPTPAPAPAPAQPEKVKSDIVSRTDQHKEGSEALIDGLFGN